MWHTNLCCYIYSQTCDITICLKVSDRRAPRRTANSNWPIINQHRSWPAEQVSKRWVVGQRQCKWQVSGEKESKWWRCDGWQDDHTWQKEISKSINLSDDESSDTLKIKWHWRSFNRLYKSEHYFLLVWTLVAIFNTSHYSHTWGDGGSSAGWAQCELENILKAAEFGLIHRGILLPLWCSNINL